MKHPTLTEAWESIGRPRPPFWYLFDHPDADRIKWERVWSVHLFECSVDFKDDMGTFNGSKIRVRGISTASPEQQKEGI